MKQAYKLELNIVEEIKQRVNTVETIGRIVSLRRSGKKWAGLCPFHNEKTGSFFVDEETGSFKCYGCGVWGDVISFYQMFYTLDFTEACDRLCKENGIDWDPRGSFKADKSKDILYEANRFAGSVYYEAIKTEGNPALTYLLGRGIDTRTISRFRIGYADSSGRMLAERLEGNAELQKAAEEVGLLYRYNGRLQDRFEGRVMFPIINTNGKVIGFGGRDIAGKAKAKYINSAGSKIFIKGANLYGLHATRGAINENKSAILVEGYMDLVSLYKHGVANVCAQLGTAFTEDQAKLLGKYAKNVTLALDSDESGQKAALKTMDILAAAGLKVRVLGLGESKDPDDFIKDFGVEAWAQAARSAKPMYDFKLEQLKKGFELSASDGRADYLNAAAALLAGLSPIEQDIYVEKLAEENKVSEEAIRMQIQRNQSGLAPNSGVRYKKPDAAVLQSESLYLDILGLALRSGAALEKAAAYRHLFDGTDFGGVMNAMLILKGRGGYAPSAEELSEALDEADQAALARIVNESKKKPAGDGEAQIEEYLIKLELAWLTAREKKLIEDIGKGVVEAGEAVLKEVRDIQKQIEELKSEIRNRKRGE